MLGCTGSTGGGKRRGGRSRKAMRGGMYGFGGALNGTTAGPDWTRVANLPYNSETGAPSNVDYGMAGGRRRRGRTGKKGTRKGKKSRASRRVGRRRRTMRGGSGYYSISGVGAGYYGQGAGGLPDFGGYSTKGPVSGGHTQGDDGVMNFS
jgi:hypothetical protein